MIAELRMATRQRNGKTVLQDCFYTPPFKVLDITEDKRDATLHLMLMNASPGVLDGDLYNLQLHLAAGSSVRLHTQSYQRLFPMKKGAAQSLEIYMEAGSSFCYVPHPTVPHKDANFTTTTKIHLAAACTLLWSDVLTCGRKGSGEQFLFSKYHSHTEIFLNKNLVVKENLLLQPALYNLTALGQLEGYTHQASLLYMNEAMKPALMDHVHTIVALEPDICFGISALPVAGFALRVLGTKGEQLHGLLKKLADTIVFGDAAHVQPLQQELKSYAH
jgi:urease accessory protein